MAHRGFMYFCPHMNLWRQNVVKASLKDCKGLTLQWANDMCCLHIPGSWAVLINWHRYILGPTKDQLHLF